MTGGEREKPPLTVTASRERPRRPGPEHGLSEPGLASLNAGSGGLGVWRARVDTLREAEPSDSSASGRKFALGNRLTGFGQEVLFAKKQGPPRRGSGGPELGSPTVLCGQL